MFSCFRFRADVMFRSRLGFELVDRRPGRLGSRSQRGRRRQSRASGRRNGRGRRIQRRSALGRNARSPLDDGGRTHDFPTTAFIPFPLLRRAGPISDNGGIVAASSSSSIFILVIFRESSLSLHHRRRFRSVVFSSFHLERSHGSQRRRFSERRLSNGLDAGFDGGNADAGFTAGRRQ